MTARRRRRGGAGEDPAAIRFGTSGWRGVLGEEITFPRLRILTRAVADWLRAEERGRRVLVGWDARFASRAMAEIAAAVLQEEGLSPWLTSDCTPTPAVTHALAHGRFAAGLVLTASHNPAADHGLKLFDASGATLSDRFVRKIEAIAARRRRDAVPARASRAVRMLSLAEPYLEALAEQLDRDALRTGGVTLFHDAMHGAAAGYLDRLMARLGVAVEALRERPDPTFGGSAPDPVPARLGELTARLRAFSGRTAGPALGIAHDGDGDRVGVVDGRGRVLSETQALALLVDHLASTGRIGHGIAIGAATGSLVEKVAWAHGLAVERHPIGFKHLSAAILAGRADVAGEESGGFAWAPMGPDKDGILAGALLVELIARSREPLERHVGRLEARFGPSACGRIALSRTEIRARGLERLESDPPARVDRVAVLAVDASDGLRLALADGGFLMFRASGTEPIVRIYAEAADAMQLERRLGLGTRLLARAGR
jgi:phosphomannomutase